MGTLSRSLRDAVRKMAFRTSVDQLKKRGVKQVNVVGLDRIVFLIEEAVHRSLRHKLLGLEREQVADATKEEFLRLLRSNEDLQRSHNEALAEKQRAEDQVDELRREISMQRQALRERLAESERATRARIEDENRAIVERIDAVFRELADRPASALPELRERMVEVVMELVGSERQAARQARQAVRDREVDVLERRIAKLQTSLNETEQRLAHTAALKGVDDGISSVYREVQGLDAADEKFERKRALMADIFEANLALQKGS